VKHSPVMKPSLVADFTSILLHSVFVDGINHALTSLPFLFNVSKNGEEVKRRETLFGERLNFFPSNTFDCSTAYLTMT
jgi:hypothetical protein